MSPLSTSVSNISGIGPARAKSLEKLGVHTLRDLVSYFPRAYEDRSVFKKIANLILGEKACVRATVASPPTLTHIRRGLDIIKLRVVDEVSTLNITFFNKTYVREALVPGQSYVFFGRVGGSLLSHEMTNPIFERDGAENLTGRIIPIYPLTAGITQNVLMGAVAKGLKVCGDVLPDPLPKSVQIRHMLAQTRFAYENIHIPSSFKELEIARRRLIFEELFVLSSAMGLIRRGIDRRPGFSLPKTDINEYLKLLPFSLTNAQLKAIDEAVSDMRGRHPMSRLIQGDVGSGKTVVAAACCWYAAKFGYQSAFMAPTEILARQHYKTLTELLEPAGINVGLLVGSLTPKKKKEITNAISAGEADVVVGTQALLSENVHYKSLALAVADEQHRFGVQQRSALSEKGESPHVLVMSATPIPRTLALIIYGDLDVSVIDELPPGRTQVDTFAVGESMRARIYAFVRKIVAEGRQVYIVCPMIEESEEPDGGLKAAREYAETLKTKVFPELSVALVHGKMKPKEKNAAMELFAAGEANILVATTVIEVGVDVPNAALMVVENADRFGLSQLHQLRGRVGRGRHKSYCILFEGEGGDTAKERLKVMCKTNDGFKIAEEDLRLRGPGDFFGKRQHGLPELKVADFAEDMDVLKAAQEASEAVLSADPDLKSAENAELAAYVKRLFELNADSLN